MALEDFLKWKEQEKVRQAELEKRKQVERNDLLSAFDNELGLRSDKDTLLLDNGASYNPFTGAYSVKNQGGTGLQTDAFYYNPNEKKTSIYGTQLSGMLDPRIALGIGTEDYESVDKWYSEAEAKVNAAINDAYNRGSITPGYTYEEQGKGRISIGGANADPLFSGNEWAKQMGADVSENYKKRVASTYRTSDSTIDEYLKRARPDVYQDYLALKKSGDDFNKDYLQRAYDSAFGRLGSQYKDDFYGGLKNQFTDLASSVAKPEQFWQEHWKKQETEKKMNDEINAIYNNPAYQGYNRNRMIEEVKAKYQPIEQKPVAPVQPQLQVQQPNEDLAAYSRRRDQMLQSGASQEEMDVLRSAYNQSAETRLGISKPDQTKIPAPQNPAVAVSPEPVSTAMNQGAPWSKEFESNALNIMGGFKTSLDDYIKLLGAPTVKNVSQPKFSLTNNMAGDTGMRNSGLVPTTPKSFGLTNQVAMPYTGKAGQVAGQDTTSTNQQALWR